MSADENDTAASTEITSGDIAEPDANTEHAQSKPEVASSDHVTDGTASPRSEADANPTDTTDAQDESGRTADTNEVPESPPADTGSPTTTTDAPSVSTEDPGTVSEAAKPAPAPRVVIVTGASSGLGLAVSRMFCAGKHDVILACRSEEKANKAIAKIRKRQPDASATYMQLDLADLDSVRAFVSSFRASGKKLSTLINNAGVILNLKNTQRQLTKDNFELTMGTNHLGHFLLTNLLLEDLKQTAADGGDARIVVVTSSFHDPDTGSKKKNGLQPLDVDDLFLFKENSYNSLQAYKNSKLANLMFTYELARQLTGTGVTVNAVDPGFMPSTELLRHSSIVQKLYARVIQHGLLRFRRQTRTCSQAAVDVYALAVDDAFKGANGKYFQNGQESKSSVESMDEDKQRTVWKVSGGYTHLEGFEPLTATPPRQAESTAATDEVTDNKDSPASDQVDQHPNDVTAAGDSEKTKSAVNSDAAGEDQSTADKPEAAPATESDEKAIEEQKPEATSVGSATRSDETTTAEADVTPETCSSSEQKTDTNEQ